MTGARPWRVGGVLALLAAGGVFPLVFPNEFVTTIAVDTMIFVVAAAAWNIFSGYSGYISLGHAVFFGAGAYTVGIAARDWHLSGTSVFALLPLAAAVAAVIAVPFGLIALRARRHTFVVITIAIFFIFQLMASNFSFTGGAVGVSAPFLAWQASTFDNPFYYLAFAMAVATVGLSWLLRESRFGLQLRAIRDDEDRARGLGVRPMRVKLAAFVLSAFITGAAGGLWFLFIGQVLPASGFDPLFDLSVALMAFLGGLGTVAGPVLGALLLEPGEQYLTQQFTNGYVSQILLGVLLLIVVLVVPRGLIPIVGGKISSWQAVRRGRTTPAGVAAEPQPSAAAASSAGAAAHASGKGAE
ncbi:MAG: branched-chain amino acid ABC transporter permease [Micromonosporaceae bacterium]